MSTVRLQRSMISSTPSARADVTKCLEGGYTMGIYCKIVIITQPLLPELAV